MQIIYYIFSYFLVFLFLVSSYGLGRNIVSSDKDKACIPDDFRLLSAIVIGIGFHILGLQLLGVFKLFQPKYIYTFCAITFFFAIVQCKAILTDLKNLVTNYRQSQSTVHWILKLILLLISVELILRPLQLPLSFDEIMYHLPHVKHWLSDGQVGVNQWLRYPYFPYNFNLLYALGLAADNEVLPHLIHAAAGWLVLFGLFVLGRAWAKKEVGIIAAFIFAIVNFNQFGTATIDLGVTLFIFYAVAIYLFWWKSGDNKLLLNAIFCFGIAVGIKYQALIFAPLVLLCTLLKERRPKWLFLCVLIACVPSIFWYLRNYLLTGNPVAPMLPQVFGVADWNAADMTIQFADIQLHKDWPNFLFAPAMLSLYFWYRNQGSQWVAGAIVFSLYGFFTWIVSSHYSRYFMPVEPIVALLSAFSIVECYQALIRRGRFEKWTVNGVKTLGVLLCCLLSFALIKSVPENLKKMHTNPEAKKKFLRKQVRSYDVGLFLQQHPEFRIVQFDFTSDIYYLPMSTIGDIFGPGRASDFIDLPTSSLVCKLNSVGANSILFAGKQREIAKSRGYPTQAVSDQLLARPDFADFFDLVYSTPEADLYAVKKTVSGVCNKS